jgi:polysaccharide export outer membrane protein
LPRYANAIGPGDHLAIDIAAGYDRTQVIPTLHVAVSDNGTVQLPELGQVAVAGKKPDSAGTAIQRDFVQNQIFQNPLVTVRIEEKRTNRVRVIGGVNRPEVYELPADQSDVLTAITMAGGLAEDAGDKIEVRTAGGMPQGMEYAATSPGGIQQASYRQPMGTVSFAAPVTISLSSLAGGGMNGNPDGYKLQDGAVVMVQKLDPLPISVRGLVACGMLSLVRAESATSLPTKFGLFVRHVREIRSRSH